LTEVVYISQSICGLGNSIHFTQVSNSHRYHYRHLSKDIRYKIDCVQVIVVSFRSDKHGPDRRKLQSK